MPLAWPQIVGEAETSLDPPTLEALAREVEARCVVAQTLVRSGAVYNFSLLPRSAQ